jgi:hypothetical protein
MKIKLNGVMKAKLVDKKKKATGEGYKVTTFSAEVNGDTVACEAYGDHLEKVLANMGQEVEVTSAEFFEPTSTYNIKGGIFSGFGGKRPFTPFGPSGYKGKPVPLDEFIQLSKHVAVQGNPAHAGALVQAYWTAVAANVTFPPGFEPAPTAPTTPGSPQGATSQPNAGSPSPTTGNAPNVAGSPALTVLAASIAAAETAEELDQRVKPLINSTVGLTDDQKSDLYGLLFQRKMELQCA